MVFPTSCNHSELRSHADREQLTNKPGFEKLDDSIRKGVKKKTPLSKANARKQFDTVFGIAYEHMHSMASCVIRLLLTLLFLCNITIDTNGLKKGFDGDVKKNICSYKGTN